jgi:WD40 repeat protein
VFAVFSPDSRLLASGAADGTLRLWDARGGGEVLRVPAHTGSVYSVAFSPDGGGPPEADPRGHRRPRPGGPGL